MSLRPAVVEMLRGQYPDIDPECSINFRTGVKYTSEVTLVDDLPRRTLSFRKYAILEEIIYVAYDARTRRLFCGNSSDREHEVLNLLTGYPLSSEAFEALGAAINYVDIKRILDNINDGSFKATGLLVHEIENWLANR